VKEDELLVEAELSDEELEELEETEADEALEPVLSELDEALVSVLLAFEEVLVVSFVLVEALALDETLLLSPHDANKVIGSAINQMILLSIQKSSSHMIKGKRLTNYRQKDKENATSNTLLGEMAFLGYYQIVTRLLGARYI